MFNRSLIFINQNFILFLKKFNNFIKLYNESFILPLSHDEVVHLKGSIINKMSGDYMARFQQLKLLYAYQYAHPGKKLLFMGAEMAQESEWAYKNSLDCVAKN